MGWITTSPGFFEVYKIPIKRGRSFNQRDDDKAEWKPAVTWGPDDAEGRAFDFTADGKGLWMISCEGRDTLALVKRDLESGKD